MTPEQLASLSFAMLEKATKNVVVQLADGTRFDIVGGRSRRPPPKGVAGFTPREMRVLMNGGIDEELFKKLIGMRLRGLADSIVEVTPSEGGVPVEGPSGSPWL